ncbi:conjugal transfer protein TraC [Rhizobium leguminosarum]|uniref:TraC family protein n=1 Tax=Rhizobium leguminosarum TaxID=384 RepID=A0A7K3VM00_RHILE|nr:conjugal transfer protein TraC [Rhizobium leguminosarum]NEK18190.1 TraC family protein [Rhizobium leguminosarum]
MKKPSSKIREEIAKLQDQLRAAETREAERIGRIALRSGIGEFDIEEAELQAAFEQIAGRFREGKGGTTGRATARKNASGTGTGSETTSPLAAGAGASGVGEA